jgi:hypothetical protein
MTETFDPSLDLVGASDQPAPRWKRIALGLVVTLAMTLLGLTGLGLAAPSADAASCFHTVTVAGANAYGYGRSTTLQNYSAFVRTAPTASLCVNYAASYGGYYIASVTCNQSSARLTSDTTSLRRASNQVAAAYRTYAGCQANSTWLWDRTVANDQCVSLAAVTRWNINQANGTVTVGFNLPSNSYFAPASSC